MSMPSRDPSGRLSDEQLLHVHQRHADEVDDGGQFKMLPLVLLFVFSGLILFAGTYLGFYSGHFNVLVQDERAHPATGEVKAAAVDPMVLGATLYNTTMACFGCHGATGAGVPGAFPPLAGSEWVTGSEERLIRVVLHGLQGPITVKGVAYPGTTPMPAQATHSDERIAAVLTYIRGSFGNSASPVTAAKVGEVRASVGNRGAWTAAELQSFQ